jgi:hypothetical protein
MNPRDVPSPIISTFDLFEGLCGLDQTREVEMQYLVPPVSPPGICSFFLFVEILRRSHCYQSNRRT